MHNCIILSDVTILLYTNAEVSTVNTCQCLVTYSTEEHSNSPHPVSLCGSSLHLRLGQPSLPKDYFGKDCPSPPNTVALAAAEADIVFIHSTQHCGEESIETVVTADPSQRIRAMFSCERSRWNGNNRSLREGASLCRVKYNCCNSSMFLHFQLVGFDSDNVLSMFLFWENGDIYSERLI